MTSITKLNNGFQAIMTKYIGPSNVRGSRVKATAEAGSITLHWDDSLNSDKNHARAAEALANKFKWRGRWYMGGFNGGYAFVSSDQGIPDFVTLGETAKEDESDRYKQDSGEWGMLEG